MTRLMEHTPPNPVDPITLKDNTPYKESDLERIPNLRDWICDKSLSDLGDDVLIFPPKWEANKDLGKNSYVLQHSGAGYRTSNVMGFIGREREALIITSRFGDTNDEGHYFLYYLLQSVLSVTNIVKLPSTIDTSVHILDLLHLLFPYYLRRAMRKGPFRQYVERHYNDTNPRGRIDIARHVVLNVPFVGNIAYSRRELTCDNPVMELIRHTIDFIEKKERGMEYLQEVREEVRQVKSMTPSYQQSDRQQIIHKNVKRPAQHAYYREYRDLQKLCLMILRHTKTHQDPGSRAPYGILFDGSALWEEYINGLISEWFYHPNNRTGKYGQDLFKDGPTIYPDFISKAGYEMVIADAKYKPAKNIGGKDDDRADYYQLLTYMFRFDAKKGYFIYPNSTEDRENKEEHFLLASGVDIDKNPVIEGAGHDDIRVTKYGLGIPKGVKEGYRDFVVTMRTNEDTLKEALIRAVSGT